MKLYKYTRLHPDGTTEELPPRKKMNLTELQQEVGGYIELVPKTYYAHKGWKHCLVYVDEDGRFKGHTHNQHFESLALMPHYNIVGMALKEEVYHG